MKPFIILLFSGCLIASYCPAQVIPPDELEKSNKPKPPAPALLVTVTFNTDDTCNLTINNKDYKEVAKKQNCKIAFG